MTTSAKAAIVASFVSDSLALGAHWIYDTSEIEKQFGTVDQLHAPLPGSFHPKKQKGDFTHYGDQSLILLQSLHQHGGFDQDTFAHLWQGLFQGEYNGYIDKATKTTLDNLSGGTPVAESGSTSTDLGGPARMAPLLHWYGEDKEALIRCCRQQTAMTHNHPATLAGAQFIALTAYAVLQGAHPKEALNEALQAGVDDMDLDIRIRSAFDTEKKETTSVIKNFGQMCAISAALPGAIHLILSYPDNLEKALISNVMAGGDSSARGMVAAMILGAYLGEKAIPSEWFGALNQKDKIESLLA